jgi:tetratricopeptide (TPR) repeat protein
MIKISKCFLPAIILSLFHLNTAGQQNKIDSILTLLKTDKSDSNKVNHLNILSHEYIFINDHSNAKVYSEKALFLALKLNNPKVIANSYFNLGSAYSYTGDYPEALENYFAALEIRDKIGDKKEIANTYSSIASVYFHQRNFKDALKQISAAFEIRKSIGDKKGMANSYNNFGSICFAQSDYPAALKYYFSCLKTYEEIYTEEKLPLYLRAMADTYSNIGVVFYEQSNFTEAVKNYFVALELYKKVPMELGKFGDKAGIGYSYTNIGTTYLAQKKRTDAINYLNKGLQIAKETNSKERLKDNFSILSEVYTIQSNFKKAFENYKLYIVYRDSLTNEENTKKTVQTQMKYDFEKKESEIKASQDKKDLIVEKERQKQKITIASVSGGLFLVLILAGVIFRNLVQNQKKNKIITGQKVLVEKQKETVEEKQKEIIASIRYAKRIQTALITSEKYIERNLDKLQA